MLSVVEMPGKFHLQCCYCVLMCCDMLCILFLWCFRCDSMGRCAQFGSYTLMDLNTRKILDVQPVSVSVSYSPLLLSVVHD